MFKYLLTLLLSPYCLLVQAQMVNNPPPLVASAPMTYPVHMPAMSNPSFAPDPSEVAFSRQSWQTATQRKWIGYGLLIFSNAVMLDSGPSTVTLAGSFVGGVMALAGMIGEDIQKHRFSRATSKQIQSMQAEIDNFPGPILSPQKKDFDFLIAPQQFRPITLQDLDFKGEIWFKVDSSPVLVIGKIVGNSNRGSRVYLKISSNLGEKTVAMGDVFIPLQKN